MLLIFARIDDINLFGIMKYSMIVLCILLLIGCEKNGPENEIPKKRTDIVLTKSQQEILSLGNEFTFSFLNQINSLEKSETNIFVSPMSTQMAFCMASAGASGETQAEILSALGMKNVSQDDVNNYYRTIVPALEEVDNTTIFTTANSIWVKKDLGLKSDYKSSLEKYFYSEGRTINQNIQKAVSEINGWCSDKTNGMIDHIINDIDPNLKLMLINALYFKGVWMDEFDPSDNINDLFYNNDGTTTKTTFMRNTFERSVWYDETVAVVSLPYGNKAYRMIIVLPADGTDINDYISTLNVSKWNSWIDESTIYEVVLSLPKFKSEYNALKTFVPALKNLGMNLAFSPKADFSGISEEPLFIGSASQKAIIIVDEKGTEAAAVTHIGMESSAGPGNNPKQFIFKVDHPFLYFISEVSTGAILFAGVQKTL